MNVAVTGASGHLGGNLVRLLLEQGHRVRCLVREDVRALEGLDVERVKGDTLQPETLQPLVAGTEVVFHLAAWITISGGHGGRVEAVNVQGPRNVAEAALAAGVRRMVHVSSIHAFHPPPGAVIDERTRRSEDPRLPAYDRTKWAGERAVREFAAKGLDVVVGNPTAVVGPCDFKPSRLGRFFLMVWRNQLPALVPGGFDWVDVRDVVQGLVTLSERGRTGESYLLGGRHTSVQELAQLAAAAAPARLPGVTVPSWLARVGAPFVQGWGALTGREPLYTGESLRALREDPRVDTSKARAELGWAPRPLEQTVRDIHAWFVQAGMLPDKPAGSAARAVAP